MKYSRSLACENPIEVRLDFALAQPTEMKAAALPVKAAALFHEIPPYSGRRNLESDRQDLIFEDELSLFQKSKKCPIQTRMHATDIIGTCLQA